MRLLPLTKLNLVKKKSKMLPQRITKLVIEYLE